MFSNMFSDMFSKLMSALLLISLTLASCSLPVNEEAPVVESPEAKLGFDSKCLKDALPVLKGFISGEAKAIEVEGVWNCFGGAIDLFYRKVKGSNKNEYTAREIARFFEDYFLAENTKISDPLLIELMRLKQIFVGGSAEKLTKDELRKLTAFSIEARDLSIDLLPYMKVYSLNWKVRVSKDLDADLKFFEEANEQVQTAAKRIGDRIGSNGQSYSLDHFSSLLEQLEVHFGENWSFIETVRKVLPLVKKLKKSLVGGDESEVAALEWRRFGLLGARGYVQYLRYYYFVAHAPNDAGGRNFMYLANSADDLFSYLGDMVREKPDGKFRKTELVEIIECLNALFPNLTSTPELIDQAMKLKQLLFGGNAEEFIPLEFDRARTKVDVIRILVERAYLYFDLYTLDWRPENLSPEDAQKYFADAETNLIEISSRLGQLMETQYDLRDLVRLAQELSRLLPPEPGQPSWGETMEKYMPVVVAGKNIIVNDNSSVVLLHQWTAFLSSVADIYAKYLQYDYFVKGRTWTEGAGLRGLSNLVTTATGSLDRMLGLRTVRRNPSVIRFAEIERLVLSLESADLLPDRFDAAAIKPLIKIVLQRFLLSPSRRLSGEVPQGLTTEGTKALRTEFGLWAEGQSFIQLIHKSPPARGGYSGTQLLHLIDGVKPSTALKEMRMSLVTPVPLTFDSLGRLYMSDVRPILYSRKSIDHLNLARALVRLVVNGYAGDMDRIRSYKGITNAEANVLFADFKSFAVRLGLIEAGNTTFADSRFREANLFAPHGDGNELLSHRESVDLVLLIMSGLDLDESMQAAFKSSCNVFRARQSRDSRISLRCFLTMYRRQFPAVFTSVPQFASFMSQLPAGSGVDLLEFDLMMINLLKAAGWVDDQSGRIKLGDTGLVPHVIQYIEAVMNRFDLSKDGLLDRDEALAAFPVFRETLKFVAKNDQDKVLRGAFAYILVKGKAPETPGEKLHFITVWVNQEKTWPIMADRRQLGTVLGYIADAMAKGSADQASPSSAEF
jgi:hypothetical protein